MTVTETPAIKTVPLRVAPELLGKTARATEAEPGPEGAAETVIQPGMPEIAHGRRGQLGCRLSDFRRGRACNVVGETE